MNGQPPSRGRDSARAARRQQPEAVVRSGLGTQRKLLQESCGAAAPKLMNPQFRLALDEPTGAGPALLVVEGVGMAVAEGKAPTAAGVLGVTPSRAS